MKMNCLHKTRTSFFNCHFFGDFKYDYDNSYANNITIMIMIPIFFPNIPFTNFVNALQRVQTIKGFIPCQREPFKTSASFSLQYKKTRNVGCAICFLDNLQGMQIDSDRLRIKLCLYMCTKQPLLHLRRLHVRDKNNKNRIYLSSVSH